MGSIKTKREEQFRDFTSGVTMGISGALFLCAFTELKAALEDREKAKNVSTDNHLSPNALGSIVLLITALDSYLNEIIQQMCPCGKDAYGFKKLVDLDAAV